MFTFALYLLTGAALYAGVLHVYTAASRQDRPAMPLLLGALWLLLALFAVASALATQAAFSAAARIDLGRFIIATGLLLWAGSLWLPVSALGRPARLVPIILSGLWGIFLVANLAAPLSLLYHAVGEAGARSLAVNPWWYAVLATNALALAYAFHLARTLYRQGRRRLGRVLGGGLVVLAQVFVYDTLVTAGILQPPYFAPFGFLGLLLPLSLYLVTRSEDAASRKAFHYRLEDDTGQDRVPPATPVPLPAAAREPIESTLRPPVDTPAGDWQTTGSAQPETTPPEWQATHEAVRLDQLGDALREIQLYTEMALRRLERGATDPIKLQVLLRKVRQEAEDGRQLATGEPDDSD